MKRVNFLITPAERLIGTRLPAALPDGVRPAVLGLAAAVCMVAATAVLQEQRIGAAERDGGAAAARLARTEQRMSGIRTIAGDRDRLLSLVHGLDLAERSGAQSANALASLGNGVPRDAWLSSIRVQGGGFAIEGRGRHLAAVSATMAALARSPGFAGARLLSAHASDDRRAISYAIALEPR